MKNIFIIFISLVAAIGGFLFGYDTAVISGAIVSLGHFFNLDSASLGFAASVALLGCAIGAVLAGFISAKIGRKKALIFAALCFLFSAIGTALPKNFFYFLCFRGLGGVGIGIASMVSPMYIAEIAPAKIRGQLVSLNQLAVVLGIFGVYFVNYYIANLGDEEWNYQLGWRFMLGSEAVPSFLFLIFLFFIPESPRWLAMKKKYASSLKVLRKINNDSLAKNELEDIKASVSQEHRISLTNILKTKPHFSILVVGILISVAQQTTGINVFLYYAPKIFSDFGSAREAAMWQTVLVGGANLLATIFAIVSIDRLGRKPLIVAGCFGMAWCLIIIGVGVFKGNVGSWLITYVLLYVASFAMSMGPVVWVLLSEIFPNQARSQFLSIAVCFQWMANFIISQTFPMINANKFLLKHFHGAFPFWFYALMCILTIIFTLVAIPETKGKKLEEIETCWRNNGIFGT